NSPLPTPLITGQGIAGDAIPQIVVSGQNLQLVTSFSVSPLAINNNCGDTATFTATPAYGATSYQWYNPSLQPISGATGTTLVLSNTHPADSGTYEIVATGPGGSVTNLVTLTTTDTEPPVMALNGSSTVAVPLGTSYTELGATAYDPCAGDSLIVTENGT